MRRSYGRTCTPFTPLPGERKEEKRRKKKRKKKLPRYSSFARRRHRQWHGPGWLAGFGAPRCCRQPQDARHHGRFGPEGLLRGWFALLVTLHLALCSFVLSHHGWYAPEGQLRSWLVFLCRCSSRCAPFSCRQAQDARHHGWSGSEGQVPRGVPKIFVLLGDDVTMFPYSTLSLDFSGTRYASVTEEIWMNFQQFRMRSGLRILRSIHAALGAVTSLLQVCSTLQVFCSHLACGYYFYGPLYLAASWSVSSTRRS